MPIFYRLKSAKGEPATPVHERDLLRMRLPQRADPDDELTTTRVAQALGSAPGAVAQLIKAGRLKGEADDNGRYRVRVRDLQRFVERELEPVELVERVAPPTPIASSTTTASDATSPKSPTPPTSSAPASTSAPPAKNPAQLVPATSPAQAAEPSVPTPAQAPAANPAGPAQPAEGTGADRSAALVAKCHQCGERLVIRGGDREVRCPSCGEVFSVVWAGSDDSDGSDAGDDLDEHGAHDARPGGARPAGPQRNPDPAPATPLYLPCPDCGYAIRLRPGQRSATCGNCDQAWDVAEDERNPRRWPQRRDQRR